MKALHTAIKNLEELFDLFNEKLYNGELERPVITIQSDAKNSSYGWCTTQKIWATTTGEEYYEINMCAEHMTRAFEEICGTLVHEMAHLYNLMNEIRDCNAAQYHNKKYKEAAEAHGLIVEKMGRYGYAKTEINDEVKEMIKDLDYKFEIARKPRQKKIGTTTKKKYHRYYCPCCNSKLYSSSELNIECQDCLTMFEEY